MVSPEAQAWPRQHPSCNFAASGPGDGSRLRLGSPGVELPVAVLDPVMACSLAGRWRRHGDTAHPRYWFASMPGGQRHPSTAVSPYVFHLNQYSFRSCRQAQGRRHDESQGVIATPDVAQRRLLYDADVLPEKKYPMPSAATSVTDKLSMPSARDPRRSGPYPAPSLSAMVFPPRPGPTRPVPARHALLDGSGFFLHHLVYLDWR